MPNSNDFYKENDRFTLDWFCSAHAQNRMEAFSLVEDMDYPVIPLCPVTKRPRTGHGYPLHRIVSVSTWYTDWYTGFTFLILVL